MLQMILELVGKLPAITHAQRRARDEIVAALRGYYLVSQNGEK